MFDHRVTKYEYFRYTLATVRTTFLAMGVLGVLAWSGTADAGPLDKAAFTATPAELLAEARAVAGDDADVVVLRDDVVIRYDDAGRVERRNRVVAVIVRQTAVDSWGTLYVDWKPFYQERPTIRARVITPDGSVAEIDPSLFHDAPVVSESPSVFSDRREIEAPLPRLAVGAVFEEEFVTKDREPLLAAGDVDRTYIGRGVPVRKNLITIEAPVKRAIKVVTRGFAKAPVAKRETKGGRASWVFDLGASDAHERVESAVPGELTSVPYIGVATGADWGAIAADYRRVVEEKMKVPFTPPADIKGANARATVDRAVAWLHGNVRYTGIELADSAIVPFPPAETMKRGFGDCKDKATLLAAILRANGVQADLALLSTGPGVDTDRDLPGMGDFDHAIVRARIDGKDLWIDATEDGLPAGQLPARDQGRLALIIAADTRGLVTTPAAAPADNLVREVRTYTLAEAEWARVQEVTTERGVFWDNMRGWVRDTKRAELSKSLTGYVERQYSGKLVSFRGDDPGDITKPFSLVVEADKVTRAYTTREDAQVWLYPTDALARVPDTFADDDKQIDEVMAKRTLDYQWFMPMVYEIEHRIVIPEGFTPPPVASPSEKRALGAMTLATTRRLEGRTLVIVYRLDTGARRLTAAQLRTTRAAVLAFQKEQGEHVVIAQTGAALMHAGKIEEAIAEYKRMIALHPKEGLHHGELAEAYAQVGMGPAARREAKRRVELEPANSDAYVVLATQLERDSVGRQLGFDADRDGAIAAYRKALALMPEHEGALGGLAWLLTVDNRGWPNMNRRDLLEAVELWRRLAKETDRHEYDQSIAETLFDAQSFADAEAAARAMPRDDVSTGIVIAAVAAQKGAPAALTVARTMTSGSARTRAIEEAKRRLFRLRMYEPVRVLHAEIASTTSSPMDAMLATGMKKVELVTLDAADPKTPALLALSAMIGVAPPKKPWDAATGKVIDEAARMVTAMPFMTEMRSLPRALVADMFTMMANVTVEGSAADGWRVTLEIGGQRTHYYVALVKGRAELVGVSPVAPGVAHEVLARVRKKDLAGAAAWMGRVADDVTSLGGSPTVPADSITAAQVYQLEIAAPSKKPSRPALEVAAAFLLAEFDDAVALPILRRCAVDNLGVKMACQHSLLQGLIRTQSWKDAADVAIALQGDDAVTLRLRATALVHAGRGAEATMILERALAAHPDDFALLQERAYVAIDVDGWAKAQPWVDKVVAHKAADARVLNQMSWTRAFNDADPAKALELAKRGERMQSELNPALANTLALIEAEAKHPYAAWQYLQKTQKRLPHEGPTTHDWYVYGRIAEQLGLRDDAIAAYKRVEPEVHELGVPTTREYAERALKRLGATP
jgi:tetratricopeptide (TPR) repeat protein